MSSRNPSYRLKLIKTFNKAYGDRGKEFRSKLRPILSNPQFRYYLAQNLIKRIQDNTDSGKDKDGRTISSYAPYSRSYKKSLAFRVYGKTNKVNLTLTGEMLASIVESKKDRGDIVLQFEGSDNKLKAAVHINGSNKKGIPQRDFFGLPSEQEVSILKESVRDFVKTDLDEIIEETRNEYQI